MQNDGADLANVEPRGFRSYVDLKRPRALEKRRTRGPPVFIREASGASLVSDCTTDVFLDRHESLHEPLKAVMEDKTGFCVDPKDAVMNEAVPAPLPDKTDAKDKTDANDESYVRMLEGEVVNLKLKLAHAQSQLEEHSHLASKRHNALQGFHDNLKGENYILNLENSRLKSELATSNKKLKSNENKCREQELVIAQLQNNATASRGKQCRNSKNVKVEKESCKYDKTHSLPRNFWYKCSTRFTNEEINSLESDKDIDHK